MQRWIFIGALLAIAAIECVIALWVFRHKTGREASMFGLLLLFASVSAIGTAIQLSVNSLQLKITIMSVWTPFFWGGVPLFVGLTIALAGYPHWLSRHTAILGGTFWMVCAVLSLTNPRFGLIHENYHLTTNSFPILSYDRTVLYQGISSITLGAMVFALALLLPTLIRSKRWRTQDSMIFLGMNVPVFFVGLALLTNTHLNFHPLIFTTGLLALAYGWVVVNQEHIAGETLTRQTALSYITEGVIFVDSTGVISDYNDTAEQIVPQLSDNVGAHIKAVEPTLWTADDSEMTTTAIADSFENEETNGTQLISIEVSEVTVGDRDYGYILTLHDSTEIRERERELEQQNDRLDAFAGTVSHDLRNPLNVAQLQLDLARQNRDSDHLEAVADAHDRMNGLIDDLLTMTRTETDLDDPDDHVLAGVAKEAWKLTDTGDSELVCGFPPDITVSADRQRLLQIFENLYRNAVEHNGTPITVRVGTIESADGEGNGFYVEDTGVGIPPSEREDIFSHGYTTSDGGTGFGLSIVQDAVQTHGWSISITESKEGGARFEILTENNT